MTDDERADFVNRRIREHITHLGKGIVTREGIERVIDDAIARATESTPGFSAEVKLDPDDATSFTVSMKVPKDVFDRARFCAFRIDGDVACGKSGVLEVRGMHAISGQVYGWLCEEHAPRIWAPTRSISIGYAGTEENESPSRYREDRTCSDCGDVFSTITPSDHTRCLGCGEYDHG